MYYYVLDERKNIVGMFNTLEHARTYANKFKDINTIIELSKQEIQQYLKGEIKMIDIKNKSNII